MPRAPKLLLIASITVTTVLAGTSVADASTPCNRPPTTATIASDDTVRLPATIHPGRAQIRVDGPVGEELQIVKPRHGANTTDLARDVTEIGEGKPQDVERDFVELGGALTGASFIQTLNPGTYYALDSNSSTVTPAQITTFTVRGTWQDAALPKITGSITAIKEMTWSNYPASIGPTGYLDFSNDSSGTHFVVLSQLQPGTTLAEVNAELNSTSDPNTSVFTGTETDSGVLSPGQRELLSYSLPKGLYAVLCFWPDDETGIPHSLMGMVRLITIR
jgi:hypothetical protein